MCENHTLQIFLIMQANEVPVQGALEFKTLIFNANRTHKLQYEVSAKSYSSQNIFSLSLYQAISRKKTRKTQTLIP